MLRSLRSAFLLFALAILVAACGGGGSSSTPITGTDPNSLPPTGGTTPATGPSISSFYAAKTTIMAGASTTLTANFSNGTGIIDNGVGTVTSGVAVTVTPAATTTYLLMVTDQAGLSTSATVTVNVVTPTVFQIGSADLPYSTTLATTTSGYYQFTGMTPGHRYAFDITASNYQTATYYTDANYSTPIECDPNVSVSLCIIEAPGTSLWVRVNNSSYFNTSSVAINATYASAPNVFEGAWNAPITLDYGVANALPHVGTVDQYNSYYSIQGLTVGKKYTFWVHSMTNDVELAALDPVTHNAVGGRCSPDNTRLNGKNVPESCSWLATDSRFDIGIVNTSGQSGTGYILRVEEAVTSEGSTTSPVTMSYVSNRASASSRVAAGGTSYYRVTGLTAGSTYSITLANLVRTLSSSTSYDPLIIQYYGGDSTFTSSATCDVEVTIQLAPQCTVTAAGGDIYFKVAGPVAFDGMTYDVVVTPPALPEGNPTPVALTAAQLPYNGQVNQLLAGGYNYLYSNYTISGLTPNTYYQVSLTNLTNYVSLQAWDASSGTITCLTSGTHVATCSLAVGASGTIDVRVGANRDSWNVYAGAFYSLDVKPAPQLSASTMYKDMSGATLNGIAIPDPGPTNLPVSPLQVPITVSGSSVTSISDVSVELFITHGSATQLAVELIAPDGTVVPLITTTMLSGMLGVQNLQLNDYASIQLDGGSGSSLPYRNAPYYGTYRPATPLHVLRGMDANGTWTLRVTDTSYANISSQTGEYRAWGISFK